MEHCDCTEKCKSEVHGDLICAALTKRDVSDAELCSYLGQVCYRCESVRDSFGRTALHVAASVGRTQVVKWLLRRRQVNVNAKDTESGYTALHRSVFYGNINAAVALLTGSDDVCDFDNLSYLDHAMKNNQVFSQSVLSNDSGEVYICGSNTNYVFGIQQSRQTPDLWESFHKEYKESIRQVCLEKFHCVMVSNTGKAYSCGHGQGGRLGLNSEITVLNPQQIKFSDNRVSYYCIRASIARDHSIFLTKTDDGNLNQVWTCGLNTHHVLGMNPSIKTVLSPRRLADFTYKIEGLCAARYHSVVWAPMAIYSWGLHGGQLGHDKSNQKYIFTPKIVTCLLQTKSTIVEVATSNGATVAATSMGDIFVLHEYQCRKITSRHKVLNLSVIGGRLNTTLEASLVPDKNCELKILVLTKDGKILLWEESDPQLSRCILSLNREIVVVQAIINAFEILFISKDGEAFHGNIKNRKKKSGESGTGSVLRNAFHQFLEKDECHIITAKKLPKIHRAVAATIDSKSENIAVIQVHPRAPLRDLPSVKPGNFASQMKTLLDECNVDDYIHDVIFVVGTKQFAAHRYIIACNSEVLMEIIRNTDGILIEIKNVQPDIFQELLLWMYTGKCNLSDVGECPKKFLSLTKSIKDNDENLHCDKDKKCFIKEESKITSKDAVRLLQELSKWFEIVELEKRLSQLTIRNGNIQFFKNESNEFGYERKITFNRFQQKDLYDMNLISKNGQILQAHKCILVARVEFFEKLYSNRWNVKNPKAEITFQCSEIILELLLEYLYTNEISSLQTMDLESLLSLLVLSDQYFLTKLKEICEVTLCHLVSLRNAIELMAIADLYEAAKLKFYVMEFICLNLPAILESKYLENLSVELLDQLTKHYQETNLIMQRRNITPYSTAPSDESITNISKLHPVCFEIDEDLKSHLKITPQSSKKRTRSHKTSTSENQLRSEADLTPEKYEMLKESTTREENESKILTERQVPQRIKAISDAQDKIRSEKENISYTKLNAHSNHHFYNEFPLICDSGAGVVNKSPKVDKIDKHVFPKLSQKQRKRLFSEGNSKQMVNTTPLESPKNPWKIIETPNSVISPPTQAMSKIIIEEKKQRENFHKMITKPLLYTQIEDKAIEDLQKFYNSTDAIEEVITVERVCINTASIPIWVQKSK